jgi:hypothetical protein
MDITDEIYSRLDESEVHLRIGRLGEENEITGNSNEEIFTLFQEFLEWRKTK